MYKKKIIRAISVFAVLAMLATIVPVVAFADNHASIKSLSYDGDTDVVTVVGEISAKADITMMAVMSDAPLDAIPGDLTADDIMYIDQEKVDDGLTYTWNFKPRDTANGSYITVFLGGTDVSQYDTGYVKRVPVVDAGTVVLYENGQDYYVNGTKVLDLSDMNEDWLAAVEIDVYDGESKVGSVDGKGVITVTSAPNEAKEYTIKFGDVEGFKAVDDMKASVISADGAAIAEFDGVASWADNSAEADSWTINVPAGNDDVTVTVTVDNVDKTGDIAGGVLTVERNAEGGAAKVVVVTAAAGTASKTWTFTILAMGQEAPKITAANVEILNSKAYGQTGRALIAVTVGADVVDPETASMTVGTVVVVDPETEEETTVPKDKLYYSPIKNKYYGVVDGTLATDEAAAALNIVIDQATPSEKLYFGVTAEGATRTKQNPTDFSVTLNKYLLKPVTLSDKQFIAMDAGAAELDGKFTPADFAALLNLYLMKTNILPVNVK